MAGLSVRLFFRENMIFFISSRHFLLRSVHRILTSVLMEIFSVKFWEKYQGGTSFVDLLCFFVSCVCYAFVRVCLFVPCGHLLSWLTFVVSIFEFVTSPLVSWVRSGT